jgi:hypothetical protein
VKQVKTKTTLKVRSVAALTPPVSAAVLVPGTSPYLSSVRRCMDLHREEPVLQDGSE